MLELHVKICSSKADQRQHSITLIIPSQNTPICTVYMLHRFLQVRNDTALKPLFVHFDGSMLTRYQFNSILQKTLAFCDIKDHIRSHSFRIGGATELSRMGVKDNEIKQWGRWASSAYESYIRMNFS